MLTGYLYVGGERGCSWGRWGTDSPSFADVHYGDIYLESGRSALALGRHDFDGENLLGDVEGGEWHARSPAGGVLVGFAKWM